MNPFGACKLHSFSSANLTFKKNPRSILGSSLYTCTETTYTHYIESKETDTVTFAARMNDIVVLPLPIQAMPVVACQDRLLRPLHVGLHYTNFKSMS